MRTITAGILTIALLGGSVHAETATSADVVLKMFEDRHLTAIQRTRPQAIEKLPLKERNEIALAAAKSLSIKEHIGVIGTNRIHKYFTTPPSEDSAGKAECRRQWGINMAAAGMLRHLCEKRLVNDPALLPHLIDALDHPDKSFVAQRCFYALQYLTRRTSGQIYWARLIKNPKKHAEIRKWWLDWLQENKDKHPVFDKKLEEEARAEVLGLAGLIEKQLKPKFRELAMFKVPQALPLRWQQPLFHMDYNPGGWALAIDTFEGVDRSMLPWIWIQCRFGSFDDIDTWQRKQRRRIPKGIEDEVTTCYTAGIEGSDIVVEVLAASKNKELIAKLQSVLRKDGEK